jgi:hypothetical protein
VDNEQDYFENRKLIYELHDLLMKLFVKEAHTAGEVDFAKHLATYVHQTILNCVDIGLKNRMLPVAKVDVWCAYMGTDTKEFMYRLAAIGGQPYVELKLQKISELLESAVKEWADESWGGIIKFGKDHPMWIIEEDE